MKQALELTVPELDCADEAQQIQVALGRLHGVEEVRTVVAARRAVIGYEDERVTADTIKRTITSLGMTVSEAAAPSATNRRPLSDLLGWGFVAVIAIVSLVGIAGERLGVTERLADQIPAWLTLAAVLAGGYPIFRNVVRALRNRSVTSHALMTIGIIGAVAIGQYAAAALIVFFMRLADFVESYTTERSRRAIQELLKLAPETARVERDGREVSVPAADVQRGEIVLVRSGERIAVDGVVLAGEATVNQAPITGESMPVDKAPGAQVFAASICDRGALRVRADRVGAATTFGQIVRLVEEAEAAKAPVQRFADRFTAYYIPVVLAVAVLTAVITGNVVAAVATVLVACSCAIAMATPITVLAAVGNAARRGIVVKGGRYLEALAKVDTLVMDKTGTLTIGRPEVTDVVPSPGHDDSSVLQLAAALERLSEHPLAAGVVRAADARHILTSSPEGFTVIPGEGVTGRLDGLPVACGTEKLMQRLGVLVDPQTQASIGRLADSGKSIMLVTKATDVVGLIGLADVLRSEVEGALTALRELGVRRLILLSGDRREVVAAIATRLGLEPQAEVLPGEKLEVIRRLQQDGHVVGMVGDGINDAPALAQSDVGIAMGVAGTDAAIEAAHVALMRDDWRAVPEAVRLGRRAFRTIKQNLWFTAAYNVIGVALAAVGWLPPVAAAAAQSLPDVAVMTNSSRLLRR